MLGSDCAWMAGGGLTGVHSALGAGPGVNMTGPGAGSGVTMTLAGSLSLRPGPVDRRTPAAARARALQ
jgi:hypothetical protein